MGSVREGGGEGNGELAIGNVEEGEKEEEGEGVESPPPSALPTPPPSGRGRDMEIDWVVCCMIASGGRVDVLGRLVRVGELYRPELGGSRGEFGGT